LRLRKRIVRFGQARDAIGKEYLQMMRRDPWLSFWCPSLLHPWSG
jgi:hypothetical protein